MTGIRAALLIAALLAAAAPHAAFAQSSDPQADLARLTNDLSGLDQDPALGPLAGLERLKARQALIRLQGAKSRDRDHLRLLAERWIEAARDAAQAELLGQQSAQLDRERDQIMVEASRRDAENARREADRLRLQSMAREEEAERLAESNEIELQASAASTEAATAEAAQARKLADARAKEAALARKEAELAAALTGEAPAKPGKLGGKPAVVTPVKPPVVAPPPANAGRPFFTLPGTAFAAGRGSLTAAGQMSVERIAGKVPAGSRVRVEGHTDGQGSDAANQSLSRQRADAVRQALIGHGIASGKVRAVGRGGSVPVADNASDAGRARNRRVEIYLE
jgi:outer membrane protein OmpA-like peptidoglycan-associated protein